MLDELEMEFNGKKITYTEYKIITRRFIEKRIPDIEELREIWIDDSQRRIFMEMLHEMQIDINFIKEVEKTDKSDTFDVIANMLFESPLITRNKRADLYIKENINEISYNNEKIKEIILTILGKYRKGGVGNIDIRILLGEDMIQMDAYNTLKSKLGPENVVKLFVRIKRGIYNINLS